MAYSRSDYWVGSKQAPSPENFEKDAQAQNALSRLYASRGALLYGPPGTGKTTLLAHFAHPYLSMPTPTISKLTRATWLDTIALWSNVQEYVEDVQAEFKLAKQYEDWSDDASASGIARSVRMLFLDDLGAERESDFSRSTVESLIDARYRERNNKQTWFTTNLSISDIGKRYSQRTLSRLCEMCDLVAYDGEDRRIARAMRNL